MQHSVAAIRHGRTRTRFAIHNAHRRERQLGLRRASQPLLASRSRQRQGTPPLLALRGAARSLAGPATRSRGKGSPAGVAALVRSSAISWNRAPAVGRRISRGRRATPWRG